MFSLILNRTLRSFRGQKLKLENGECFCNICMVHVSWSGMAQHCWSKKEGQKTRHQEKLEVRVPCP